MLLVLLLVAAYLAYGILEYRLHLRTLNALPIRVHVNGTRGKSSVTRLIAAGLRAGGIRTAAKTTGSAARYIAPDGTEEPVVRPGPPNIREQLSVVARARRDSARALVVECMAIRPDLQRVCEHRIVRSTIGVITNVRADHLDIMGPTVDDVARALAGTVPARGVLFTAERERLGPIGRTAAALGTEVRTVSADSQTADLTRGFRYVEHRENVALALAVCERLGVPAADALAGMRDAAPDPGALTIRRVGRGGKEIEFVNAFAANDRESTLRVWNMVDPRAEPGRTVIAVVGMRADRPHRAYEFGEIIANDLDADIFVLTGGLTRPVVSVAAELGLPRSKVIDMGGRPAGEVLERVFELTPERSIVVGVGNIGGIGGELAALLEKEARA